MTPDPRVVLHVGVPKSGTTFIQEALWRNLDDLRAAGFQCPGPRQRAMFLGALEVRGNEERWGLRPDDIAGTWQRLTQEARAFPGTTIMSHEVLGGASADEAAAARGELEGLEQHVVVTARDPARQAVSEWQERVKNGSTTSFADFERVVVRSLSSARRRRGSFWRNHDVPAVLERWSAGLPVERVHVVTAPRSGTDPLVLWRRFGAAAGFDAEALDPVDPDGQANQSLGVAQIALLRQVNDALDGRIPQPAYARVVKRFLAQGLLVRHRSPRPACPSGLRDALRQVAEEWIHEIGERGWTVHGDLADLLPDDAPTEAPHPDEVDPRQQADISAGVVADLLVEVARLRAQLRGRSQSVPAAAEVDPGTGAQGKGRKLLDTIRRR